jgi:hypothetical protein
MSATLVLKDAHVVTIEERKRAPPARETAIDGGRMVGLDTKVRSLLHTFARVRLVAGDKLGCETKSGDPLARDQGHGERRCLCR